MHSVTMPDTLTTNRPIPLSAHLSHIFLVIWPFITVFGIARYDTYNSPGPLSTTGSHSHAPSLNPRPEGAIKGLTPAILRGPERACPQHDAIKPRRHSRSVDLIPPISEGLHGARLGLGPVIRGQHSGHPSSFRQGRLWAINGISRTQHNFPQKNHSDDKPLFSAKIHQQIPVLRCIAGCPRYTRGQTRGSYLFSQIFLPIPISYINLISEHKPPSVPDKMNINRSWLNVSRIW